jgi:hypothetical protein
VPMLKGLQALPRAIRIDLPHGAGEGALILALSTLRATSCHHLPTAFSSTAEGFARIAAAAEGLAVRVPRLLLQRVFQRLVRQVEVRLRLPCRLDLSK